MLDARRITVETILGYLSAGDQPGDILKAYPMLELEDISAALAFAHQLMANKYVVMSSV